MTRAYQKSEDPSLRRPPRPKTHTTKKARARKRRKNDDHERAEKAAVRKRDDNRCRVPICSTPFTLIEVAHLEHKGMGGDPKQIRTQRQKMLCLCMRHHRVGPISLDRGTLWIKPVNEDNGTDGTCVFSCEWGKLGRG